MPLWMAVPRASGRPHSFVSRARSSSASMRMERRSGEAEEGGSWPARAAWERAESQAEMLAV